MYSANFIGKQMDSVYGLYLPEYTIPAPEVQTNFVEILGRDGSIDKTAPDGIVRYKDREWELTFKKTGANVSADDIQSLSTALMNDLHGRRGNVIFDDDPNYKWVGRIFVIDVSCKHNGLIIAKFRFVSEPYKYGIDNIVRSAILSSTSQNVTLQNGRKPIIPTIIVSGDNASAALVFTIKGNEYSISLNAGTVKVSDLVLFEGNTVVAVTGSGNISFTYPEASL